MYSAEIAKTKRMKAISPISPKNDKTLIALKFKELMCQKFKGRINLFWQDDDELYYCCYTPWCRFKVSVKGLWKREVFFEFDQWDNPLSCPLLPQAGESLWEDSKGYIHSAGYFVEKPLPYGWRHLELDEGPLTLTGIRNDGRVISVTLPCKSEWENYPLNTELKGL